MRITTLIEVLASVVLFGWAVLPHLIRTRPTVNSAQSALVVSLPALALVLPTVLVSLSDDVSALHIPNNNLLTLVCGLPFALALAVLGLIGLVRRQPPLVGALLVAAQCAEAGVLAVVGRQGWMQPVLASALAIVVSFAARRSDGADLMRWSAKASMLLLMIGLATISFADPSQFLGLCRADKCSLSGQVLVQGLSGNNLGIFVATSAPLALLGLPLRRFLAGAVAIGLFIDLTSARAALLGYGVTVVVLALGRVRAIRRSRTVAFGLLVAALVSAGLPFYRDWSFGSFTSRGQLWLAAKSLIGERPVFGWGPAFWTSQPPSPNFPNYGTHNAVLEVLVATGVVGLALIVAAFTALVAQAGQRAFEVVVLLIPICVTGALESTFATQRFTILFGFLPIYLALAYTSQVRGARTSAQGKERALRGRRVEASSI